MACWLYEGMLLFAVMFMAGWLFSTLTQMRNAMDPLRPGLQGFVFIVFGVYFAWFWAKGQTLAMKTWNIRLVDYNGQSVPQWRALWRYALSWLWFLPPLVGLWLARERGVAISAGESVVMIFGWIAVWALLSRFHAQRQFLHDALAGTRLITWVTPPRKPPAPGS